MALTLNPFRRYIDLKTSEGLKIFNSALHGFESPLAESAKINLVPQDFQKLSDHLNRLGNQFGFDYLFKRVATTRTIIPAIPAIAAIAAIPADPLAVPPILAQPRVPAVAEVPEVKLYGDYRNMLENYSSDNLNIALINASVIWGDESFTAQMPQEIRQMTIANGLAMTPANLKPSPTGEVVQLQRMHSKFMAHQVLSLLTPTARQTVEQLKKLYTWVTPDGKEEEMDGLTILAIILNRIRPHYKVDMYLEIEKLKKETLEQHGNQVDLYFDSVRLHMLGIMQKNTQAYTDDQFVRDLFKELKGEQLPSPFRLEFERAEVKWLMNRENYTSESLMNEASLFALNLKSSGGWKIETNKHQQIIALTTQLNEMESKLAKLTPKVGGPSLPKTIANTGDTPNGKGTFGLWRLKKVQSSEEHCMVERDGKKWYWCEDGHSFENKPCGMYCIHKPGAGHIAWLERKEKYKQAEAAKKGKTIPTPSVTLPASNVATKSNIGEKSKLSLSKSLQSALMTTAGISEDQFKKIWADACASSGN